MKKSVYRLLLLLLLFPLLLCAYDCKECGKKIRRNYIKSSKGEIFCSKRCFNRTLPRCASCRKVCDKGVLTLLKQNFCSKKCMYRSMRCAMCRRGLDHVVVWKMPDGRQIKLCRNCTKNPKCYFCGLPSIGDPLPDGRKFCRQCRKKAVKSEAQIAAIFKKVRDDLARWYGFDSKHRIELKIVDLGEMEEIAAGVYLPDGGKRLALMRYYPPVYKDKRLIRKERCQIFVLNNTPRDVLLDTLAHELTHDHLRHNVGAVKDLATEEGFCELVSSLYNIRIKQSRLNKAKEAQKDHVYGDGYRKMREIYRRTKSLKKTMKFVR